MRLENKTKIEDDHIRQVIQTVKPNGISKFDVLVSYGSKQTHGRALGDHYLFRGGVRVSDLIPKRINAYLSKDGIFPYVRDSNQNRKNDAGYQPLLVLDSEEELHYLIAHELRHLWQFQHRGSKRGWLTGPYRWGSRQSREYDACAYGIMKVREYRRLHQPRDRIDLLPSLIPMTVTVKNTYFESKGMVKVAAIARSGRASEKPKPAQASYKVQRLVTFFRCLRCGKEWIPRFADKEPTVCKFCKNPYWNKPREK